MKTKTLYFDLDGVLTNFDAFYTQLTGTSYPHDDTLTPEQKDEKWKMLDGHPNFFLDLPWIPGAQTMIAFTMKHSKHSVGILSAASRRIPQSPVQKQEWCKRELPWLSSNNIVIVPRKQDKLKYVESGNILVDDLLINIERWREAGGIGIHFQDVIQAMNELQTVIQAPESLFTRTLANIKREI